MTNAEILSHIDHTVLKADAKWENIAQICEEALRYHTASVCIPPWYVGRAKKTYPRLNVCTVVGFPLGYEESAAKAQEASTMLNWLQKRQLKVAPKMPLLMLRHPTPRR